MTKVKCLICGKEFDWLPPHLSLEYLTDGKCFYTKDETKERIYDKNLGGGFPCVLSK